MTRRAAAWLLALAAWPATGRAVEEAAVAERADASPRRGRLQLSVGADAWHDRLGALDLPADDGTYGEDGIGAARLRAGLIAPLGGPRLRLHVEADAFAGRMYGDVRDLGGDRVEAPVREADPFTPFPVMPRKLFLEWETWLGVLRAGHQTSHWGLGIVAHGGERDGRLFGDALRGSVVERLLFATAPLQAIGARPTSFAGRFTLVLAADYVFADETARLFEMEGADPLAVRDRAWQGVVSALVRPRTWSVPATGARHDLSGGFYGVRRGQTYANGDSLDVWVLDGHVQYVQEWSRTNAIRYAVELAWITGETDRLSTVQGPTGVDVASFGAAFEMGWRWRLGAVPLELSGLAGVASGDGDPDDAELQRFTFHRDYQVGLVLFDQVIPALQRRSVERLDDPVRAKDPPRGFENLAGRGGVSGAGYGGLRLTVGPWRGIDAGAQLIAASTSAPFTDPLTTFMRGGAPTNPYGGPAEGTLGHELDLAARYTLRDVGGSGLSPSARLTWGVLLPGAALEGPEGTPGNVHLVQLKLAVDYDLGGGTRP